MAEEQDIAGIARDNGVSEAAARTMLEALERGHGRQAQFDHPDLGGAGQWQGGMLMIGDMFNDRLKAKVSGLIEALAPLVGTDPEKQTEGAHVESGSAHWWPKELGKPSAVGAQNDFTYAVFPESRRIAVRSGGRISIYDTGDHRIGGVSQQQPGSSALRFSSQLGSIGIEDLERVTVS